MLRPVTTFEAATSCTHRIKRTAIILRDCHKTRLFDLPLKPSIHMKHLRVKGFLMVIAPSDKNWGNVGFPMFPGSPPASDQWWGDHHRVRVFLCNSIVTGLHSFIIFRSVNISFPGFHPSIIRLLNLHLTQQRNYLFYKVVGNI